jgi:signal transduction histidine kinase
MNLEQGTLAARDADGAWSRTRAVSFALDVSCAVLTAGLALLALRSTRRAVAAETRRAAELDAFAARIAHDIRGPLTPSLFALERLRRDFAPEDPRRAMADRGLRGLQRVTAMVDDLLAFARSAAPSQGEACASLREAISGAVQDLEREAAGAGVEVAIESLPSCKVRCAPGVLASIVGNLVGNAVKYMPEKTEQRLVCIRARASGARVRVEVCDTGAGIPAADQQRIFEPYVRGESHRPGLGLGLATVKRLVQAHGGEVGVQARAGGGSVFWFELPLRPDGPGGPSPSPTSSSAPAT